MEKKKKIDKAVALLYKEGKNSAPEVLASGQGRIAQKIIETAKDAGVHIQEDPNLVELLAKIPIGDQIPVDLYQTVAEVLAFVYKVNEKYREKMQTSKQNST
jgi:flagellar biosynthesis protein